MIRRLLLVTILIITALCALTGLGYHALNKWAQGLEGMRKGEYADITVQLQTEVKAGLDAFLQKEDNRPYTDYLYYHMPDNAWALSQQQQAAPLVLRSPLSGQLDQGLAYGHFQIEPNNRITTPNDDIQAREGLSYSNGKIASGLDQWRDNLGRNLLQKLKLNRSEANQPKALPTPQIQQAISPRSKSNAQQLAIDSLQNTSQKSQMFRQNRAVIENNFSSNTIVSSPLTTPGHGDTQAFQVPIDPETLEDTIQIRVEPLVPRLVPNDANTPSIFGGQILVLEKECFNITLQCRQRRAQIMGYVGDEFPAQRVRLSQFFNLRLDSFNELFEGKG